jgi:hypothetical protein
MGEFIDAKVQDPAKADAMLAEQHDFEKRPCVLYSSRRSPRHTVNDTWEVAYEPTRSSVDD